MFWSVLALLGCIVFNHHVDLDIRSLSCQVLLSHTTNWRNQGKCPNLIAFMWKRNWILPSIADFILPIAMAVVDHIFNFVFQCLYFSSSSGSTIHSFILLSIRPFHSLILTHRHNFMTCLFGTPFWLPRTHDLHSFQFTFAIFHS